MMHKQSYPSHSALRYTCLKCRSFLGRYDQTPRFCAICNSSRTRIIGSR